MIAFIKGIVQSYGSDWLIVDHNGMGWQIAWPHPDQVHLNQEITVYTYLHSTEQGMSLYGFSSQDEKELFLRLISVKGLGPRTALNMLAKTDVNQIISAIENGNVTTLKALPGIGAKTASQIVLDLKGKLITTHVEPSKSATKYGVEIMEACDGLKNLGYRQNEIDSAAAFMNERPGLQTEEYLKIGLQFLMKKKIGG